MNVIAVVVDVESQLTSMEVSLGLIEGKLSQDWNTLSGGERQRSIIGIAMLAARILSTTTEDNPPSSSSSSSTPAVILLLDEPTAACDPDSCRALEQAIIASGVAAIIVTHDNRQAARFCHKRIKLTAL